MIKAEIDYVKNPRTKVRGVSGFLSTSRIKEHMVDVDTVLTPDEKERLEESLEDFEEGKTTSLEDFEKEMKENAQD